VLEGRRALTLPRAILLICGVALALGLASCASDGESTSSPTFPGPPTASNPPTEVPGRSGGPPPACDRFAAPDGSDSGTGSSGSPFGSAQRLVDSLAEGQTGCFRNGLFDLDEAIEVRTPGITLTSAAGERGTVRGLLKINEGADRVTVSNLDIDGRSRYRIGPVVYAADTTFDNLDVTNYNTGICFILGPNDPAFGRAVNTVIQDSRIHHCGRLPAQNGDHGIYVAASTGAVIRNNWIYDNVDRGIQLYPDSQGSRVYGNVIDGNGQGMNLGGNGETASAMNWIADNVISNSTIRWNVESSWRDGLIGSGNVVRDNCLFASNANRDYNGNGGIIEPTDPGSRGFATARNLVADPRFADRGGADLRLRASSACVPLLVGAP